MRNLVGERKQVGRARELEDRTQRARRFKYCLKVFVPHDATCRGREGRAKKKNLLGEERQQVIATWGFTGERFTLLPRMSECLEKTQYDVVR